MNLKATGGCIVRHLVNANKQAAVQSNALFSGIPNLKTSRSIPCPNLADHCTFVGFIDRVCPNHIQPTTRAPTWSYVFGVGLHGVLNAARCGELQQIPSFYVNVGVHPLLVTYKSEIVRIVRFVLSEGDQSKRKND